MTCLEDAAKARESGNLFHEHIIRRTVANRTPFENAFIAEDALMTQLGRFVDAEPPQLLWRNNGEYKDLFRFLASRFLSAPDHVLDAEGTHALWKWIETVKRGISFRTLNAVLRLQSYLRANGVFPESERLEELCAIVRRRQTQAAHAVNRDLIDELGDVGRGIIARHIHQERFNLRPAEMRLIRQVNGGANAALDATPEIAWGNYIRFLFQPNCFYNFSNLSDRLYLFIGRTRAAPGREKIAEGEAVGRMVTHAWFELDDEFAHEGHIVRPVTMGQSKSLELRNATIAEIIRAAGLNIDVEGSVRDMELRYEASFATLGVIRFEGQRFEGRLSEWYFILSESADLEEFAFLTKPVQDLTKMALARRLQILEGSDDDVRSRRWELTKEALLGLLMDHHAGIDMDVDDEDGDGGAPRGRGRGRGRAKAKGRGEGRGRGRGRHGPGGGGGGRGRRGRGGGR